MEQNLFNLSTADAGQEEGIVEVRPNLWLMSSVDIPPLLFTAEEAARCLNVGRPKVFHLIRQGALRSVKVGNSRRISARALSDYVIALELGEHL